MAAMTGVYAHTIDDKGRLFIPAKLLKQLGDTFYVTLSMDECLSVYSSESWAQIMERYSAMPYSQQRKLRPLFANAAAFDNDSKGRILLPQNLREAAKLTKDVAIIGVGNRVEIWDAEKWAEVNSVETASENIAAVMEEIGF